jgi:hypothetical protein
MSDNFFDTEFGTTVMGHLNLISGQTLSGVNYFSRSTTTISPDDDNYKLADRSLVALH